MEQTTCPSDKIKLYLKKLKYGTMEIVCKQTGYKAVLSFKTYSWTNRELHKVEGFVYDNK